MKGRLLAGERRLYSTIAKAFATHKTVHHDVGKYAHSDVATNFIRGVSDVLKRGMKCVYQHCGEQHFLRYLNEAAAGCSKPAAARRHAF